MCDTSGSWRHLITGIACLRLLNKPYHELPASASTFHRTRDLDFFALEDGSSHELTTAGTLMGENGILVPRSFVVEAVKRQSVSVYSRRGLVGKGLGLRTRSLGSNRSGV